MLPEPAGWAGDLDVRTPTATVVVDLGAGDETYSGDGLVSYRLDRELTGDLPEQVRGQAGMSAAALDLVLAVPDEEVTPTGWSPWRRALRPGGRVTFTVGWDGAEVQKFTGRVLRVTAPAGSATMTVACIDDSVAARDSTALELPLLPSEVSFGKFTAGWPLATLAFGAGYRNVPPVGDGCVIAVPLQGSVRPERVVGDVDWPVTVITDYRSAPFETVSGVEFLTNSHTFSVDRFASPTGFKYGPQRGAVVSAVLSAFGSVTLHDGASRWFRLRRTTTVVEAVYATSSAGLDSSPTSLGSVDTSALDFTDDPVYAQVELNHNTTTGECSYELTAKGLGSSSGTASVGAGDWAWTTLQVNRNLGSSQYAAGVQVLDGTAGAVDLDVWEPTFHTTGSAVDISAIPYMPDTVRWNLMGEIAASELGALVVDEFGVLRFRDHASMVDAAPVAEITAERSIAHLAWSSSLDALRNRVHVDWTPARVEGVTGSESALHTFSLRMDGDSTVEVWIELPAEVPSLVTPVPETTIGATIGKGEFKVYDSSDTDVTAAWVVGGEVRLAVVSPVRANMQVINPTGGPWRMEGNIAGRYRTWFDEPSAVVRETGAEDAYGARADLTLASSPWRQDRATAAQVASWLVSDVGSPRPVLNDVGIIPNPLLQLTDAVELRDPVVTDLHMRCLVTAEQIEGGPGRMSHRVSLRELGWTLDDFDATYAGMTLDDFDALWAGKTHDDFDREFRPGA